MGWGVRRTLPRLALCNTPYTLPYTLHPPPPTLHYTLHTTPCTLHPTPYSSTNLNSTPYTLHSTPYTLHPSPYILHPTPYTLHPTPHTLHPTPYTLHPSPYTLHPPPYALLQNEASAPSRQVQTRALGMVKAHFAATLQVRERLVFKAHRLLYHSTLGSREVKKREDSAGSSLLNHLSVQGAGG